MPLIDSHAHLDDNRFRDDFAEMLARAKEAEIVSIVTIGIDRETSRAAVELARRYPEQIQAVVGLHPNHVAEAEPGDWEVIAALAHDPIVVGVGESGFDRYWDRTPIDQQEASFYRHLALCRETGLPIVIHCREAEADVLRVLRDFHQTNGPIRGVIHSFAGDPDYAQACIDLGLHISFSGTVTYPKSHPQRAAAKIVPLERILVETDCPYLAPQVVRGRRNEPAFVAHTAQFVADVKEVSLAVLAEHSTRNAREVFRRL